MRRRLQPKMLQPSSSSPAASLNPSTPCKMLIIDSIPVRPDSDHPIYHQPKHFNHPSYRKIDFLLDLPIELALYILLLLADHPQILLRCRLVSKAWRDLAEDPLIWREIFLSRSNWNVKYLFKPISSTTSTRLSSLSSAPPAVLRIWCDTQRKRPLHLPTTTPALENHFLRDHTVHLYHPDLSRNEIITPVHNLVMLRSRI